MQTQLETTLIHIAVSDRPIYTSESVTASSLTGFFEMTFLYTTAVRLGIIQSDESTHQSVRSIATYMAPSAKMTWNHEYWKTS